NRFLFVNDGLVERLLELFVLSGQCPLHLDGALLSVLHSCLEFGALLLRESQRVLVAHHRLGLEEIAVERVGAHTVWYRDRARARRYARRIGALGTSRPRRRRGV